MSIQCGLWVRLEAKAGQEQALEAFLASALPLAQAETTTPVWFACKINASTFAIFDAFANADDRQAHLAGPIASALMAQAPHLLAQAPEIVTWDTVAVK